MADTKIDVSSYAGYQGEESPRIFYTHGEKITVLTVLEMWIEEEELNRKRRRFFRLQGSDGFIHKLYLDLETREWFQRSLEKNTRGLN
jgi:hypothetical protein